MKDLISRQAVLNLLHALPPEEVTTKAMLIQSVKQMDVAQPEKRMDERTETHACDCISKTAAIDIVEFECGEWRGLAKTIAEEIEQLPSAQPEHLVKESGDLVKDLANDDAISRKAALDALEWKWAGKAAIVAIKKLPPVQPGQWWIPCCKGIPKEKGMYLTTTKDEAVYCDYWNGDNFEMTELVIAWMPLPEPYKEDDHD